MYPRVISLATATLENIENVNGYFILFSFMHKMEDKLTADAKVQVGIGSNWYKNQGILLF